MKKLLYIFFIIPLLGLGIWSLGLGSSSAQECGIIYVTPSGVSSGLPAGTRANPANLLYGLNLVSPTDVIVWLADGVYNISSTLSIPDGVTIEGGFDPVTWIKTNANTSNISRDALNPDLTNLTLIGLEGSGISGFRLQDLTITVADAPGNQISVYGIYLDTCSNYNITRCQVNVGAGSPGVNGNLGANGTTGGNGGAGSQGNCNNQTVVPGGPGGTGAGGNNGGNGANGGKWNGSAGGSAGLPGGCGGGGASGDGPEDCWFCSPSCGDVTPGSPGGAGGSGTAGSTGAPGPPGSVTGGYFVPGGAGVPGINGTNGCGGGGGGGGGGRQQSGDDDRGGGGGGGGGGGEGGFGGTGGIGGGSSYAIFLYINGANGVIQDCDLNPGAAGPGGAGSAGGIGGSGGAGGAGGAPNCCGNSYGGAGGSGGSGGNGGNGGNGATGESVALSENGGTSVSNLGITSVPGNLPVIAVKNYGCVNAEVIFYDGPGVYITNFGAGASPATATGIGPHSVIYSSLGRKTIITSDGTVFTDYLGIFNNGPFLPSIISSDTVTLGCPASFSTSLTGTYYEWIFGSVASPDTIAGASFQTVDSIYFNALGTYTVELWVTDTCCGRVRDTITVTVDSSSLNVSLAASNDTICVGDSITFIAGGGYISYEFFINDSSVQSGADTTFITTGLQPGDTIVVVAFAGICYTNPSAVLTPVVIPIPPVTITSSDTDSTICQGDSVIFTALPATYADYEFFVNGISAQSGSSNIFVTANLANGDSVTVVSYLGCSSGPPSNTIVFTVNPLPIITLTSSDLDTTICDGDTVTLIASPAGFSDYEFFVNGFPAQSGASNTGTTPLLSDGDSIVVIATNSFGCVGPPSNYLVFTVNPIPSVSLSLTSPDDTVCLYETISITASPAGYDNYTFLDGSDTLQSGVDNFYSSGGLSAGNHNITVVATDLGCSSPVSNIVSVTVLSGPSVILATTSDTICDGDNVTFTASPSGLVNYEFFVGANSVQTGPGNTFITIGLADGDSVTVIATALGCPGPVSNVIVTTVNPLPIVTLASTDTNATICDGDMVLFTASPAGISSYEFYINGISVQSGALETYVSSSLVNGDSITVIATSSEGCLGPVSNTLVFTVNPIPSVIVASPDDSICLGDNVSFIASPAGYDNYVFFDGTDTVQSGAGNVYSTTGLDSMNNITVIVTDLGCSSPVSNDTSVVVIYGPSVVLTGSDPDSTICAGDNVIFTSSPGYANYEFFIGVTSVQNGSANTYTTTGLADGDIITVIVTDLGCPGPSSNAIVFTVNPIPIVSLTSFSDTICLNDNISFTASPAGYDNYSFYDGVTLLDSGASNIYITDSLQFVNSITVVATDLGCTSLPGNSVSVTVLPLPTVAFDWACDPDPFVTRFFADSSIAGEGIIVSWNWDFGDGGTSTDEYPSHAFSDTGEFSVSLTVTTDKGCSGSATDTVQAPPMAEFGLAPTVTVISNPLIIFTDSSSNDVISWQWDFGDPDSDSNSAAIQDPTHTYGSELSDTGVYYILLTVENAAGCRDTITHSVWIQGEYFIFTPNAFTPDNEDDFNSVFIPKGIGIENDFQMFIYDRWGNMIYETDDIDKPWDGRANGGREIAPQDVYVWVVYVRDNLGKKHQYVGHVTLIR